MQTPPGVLPLLVTRETGGFTAHPAILPNFPAKHFSIRKTQVWIFKLPTYPGLGFHAPEQRLVMVPLPNFIVLFCSVFAFLPC